MNPAQRNELPAYVERGGDAVLRPPYEARNVDFFGFAIRASRPALDSILDRYINEPSQEVLGRPKRDFRAATDTVLVIFTNTPRLGSTDRFDVDQGSTSEREVSLWVLGVDPATEDLGFFVPYIFNDSPVAVTTGREVFGFPKRLAAVGMPTVEMDDPWRNATMREPVPLDSPHQFGYLFKNLENRSVPPLAPVPPFSAFPTYEVKAAPGQKQLDPWDRNPVIGVETDSVDDQLTSTGSGLWTRGSSAIERVLEGVVGTSSPIFVGERTGQFSRGKAVALKGFSFSRDQASSLGTLATGIAENYDRTTVAFNLRGLIDDGGIRLLFLKQFRDAARRGRAAYQDVFGATMQFSGDQYTRGFNISTKSALKKRNEKGKDEKGVLPTGLTVRTRHHPLFPIQRELGVQEEEEVKFAFYLRFGFTIEMAKDETTATSRQT